jgi:hypothetical protein
MANRATARAFDVAAKTGALFTDTKTNPAKIVHATRFIASPRCSECGDDCSFTLSGKA